MWEKKVEWAIGGLLEIGFKSNSDLLMVLSSQGRGIFDCLTAERIGRDYIDYYNEKWDCGTGIVEGFGVLDNEEIICGGFEVPDILKKETIDNWKVIAEIETRPDWQNKKLKAEVMYLKNLVLNEKQEVGVFHYGINRGYGFSETGDSFVIATSSEISVWNRKENKC